MIWITLVVLSACVPNSKSQPTFGTTETPSSPVITPNKSINPKPTAGDLLQREEAITLMDNLLTAHGDEAQQIIDRITKVHDVRFTSVFLELMRGSQIGITPRGNSELYVQALESLSGQNYGDNWHAWVEWYGKTELEPPPGFLGWKGEMLSQIDLEFSDFLYEGAPFHLRIEEIVWGGVVVDGIPALDNPLMLNSEQANYLPEEPVFGISINDDARAYPLRIMDWHEMVNDVVGGVPVSLAYCTLCGAGIAYDGRISNGESYTFGSSGLLYRSNKLMYDRQTKSLWNQLTGEPVLGELADDGLMLDLLPVVLTSWQDWRSQHPNTKVLSLETGYNRPYELGAAYGHYFSSPETMFPVWQRSDLLQDKARVYALNLGGVPKAYPLETLIAEKVINDTLNDIPIVLIATRGSVNVDGEHRFVGKVAYDSGGEVRAYQRNQEVFKPGLDPDSILDSSNNIWQVKEEALIGPHGERAPRVNGHLAYWFGWYAFFPNTLVYGH